MIIFDNVTKHFGIGEPALKNVSFTIEPGEFVFVTGHSGAGKTTIARLLTKEYAPTDGSIVFDGTDLSTIRRSQLHHHRRKFGVIYQDYKLLSDLTVAENIALALHIIGKKNHEIEERITDLLDLVQLQDKREMFPSQLSGGEAQRISIARALATAPSVLFADEPTGNLDRDTAERIIQILQKVNALGTTVIMATHDESLLSDVPHRIFRLTNGELTILHSPQVKKRSTIQPTAKKTPEEKSTLTQQKPSEDESSPEEETDE